MSAPTPTTTPTTDIPISFFDDVRQNRPAVVHDLSFDDIVNFLASAAEDAYDRKEDAPLLASCRFHGDQRAKARVETSAMVMLDIDDGTTIEAVGDLIDDLEISGFLYSTASHRPDHHKFRVGVPLEKPVDADTYTKVWWSLSWLLDDVVDPSKRGAESLFYWPGVYQSNPPVFEHWSGATLSSDAWIDWVDRPDLDERMQMRSRRGKPRRKERRAANAEHVADRRDLRLHDSKLVTEKSLNAYLDQADAVSPNWHHARYRFMCSVAGRAAKLGIKVSAADIRFLFNQVDELDGGFYGSSADQEALLGDAERALELAGGVKND